MRTYLRGVLGESYREDVIEAFLRRGPEALAFLEDHTELKYSVRELSPDYYPELPGATDCGRALEVGEFDGSKLGSYFERLRPPPRCMMGFGGMMVNRLDIYHYMNMRRSLRSRPTKALVVEHCTRPLPPTISSARIQGRLAGRLARYNRR